MTFRGVHLYPIFILYSINIYIYILDFNRYILFNTYVKRLEFDRLYNEFPLLVLQSRY